MSLADGVGVSWRLHATNRHLVGMGALLLLTPNVLFALHLRPLAALMVLVGAVGIVALLRHAARPTARSVLSQPIDIARLGLCLMLSTVLLVLGGEGHIMFANWDWLSRDAVLADLAKASFPPVYQVGGHTFFLRAPLGMYMLPALVAKATTIGIGHAALLAQNSTLLALILYMLATLAGRNALAIGTIFLAFSGLDAAGELVMWFVQGKSLASFELPSHIESWAPFQYSSVITQLFWVPNHALPACWLTLLVFLCAKREIDIIDLGLVLAACLFWSPFAVIGIAPFALFLVLRDAKTALSMPRLWIAAGVVLCFAPVVVYMQTDAAQVPHEFLLFIPWVAPVIALFLAVEIPHVVMCRQVWKDYDRNMRPLLIIAIIVLLVLPTMRIGISNDLVMRGSIPALMILAIFFGEAVMIARSARRWRLLTFGIALALVAAITPLQELRRSLLFSRYAISDCNLVTAWKRLWPSDPMVENYLARLTRSSDWLMTIETAAPFTDDSQRVCWPDYPYNLRSSITKTSNATLAHEPKGAPL